MHLKQVILRQISWATILPRGLLLELDLFVELRQIEVLLIEGEITLAKERIREKKMMTTCGQRKHWKKTATLMRSSLKPLVQKGYPQMSRNLLIISCCMTLVKLLVNQTNLYFSQCLTANPSRKAFPFVCEEEILAYPGVIIAMGIYKCPTMSNYWKLNGISSMPWFCTIFSRNIL